MKTITIPRYISTLDNAVFKGCSSLESVVVSARPYSIGKNTFEGCAKLASIHLPSSITAVGDNAFKGCTKLTVECIEDSALVGLLADAGVKTTTVPEDYVKPQEDGPNLFLFVIIVIVILVIIAAAVVLKIYLKKRKIKMTTLKHDENEK